MARTQTINNVMHDENSFVGGTADKKSVNTATDSYKSIMHRHNVFNPNEIDLYNKIYRFGLYNPYNTLSTVKEFLFFTKPDLNIIDMNLDEGGDGKNLNKSLDKRPFWTDIFEHHKKILPLLENSYDPPNRSIHDPFNHLLQNQVVTTLDVPSLSSEMVDTPVNMHGVGYSYRGSSEGADDNPEFSLEFKDTRNLDVYYYFKTYEEYETLKHHGLIMPYKPYIVNKVLHDQFAIYKFMVDEDMETIIYYGKMYGVTPKSLPRDVFSNVNFDSGLSYSIDFKAAFYEDMIPDIIADFNALSKSYTDSLTYDIDIYDTDLGQIDGRAAMGAYVKREKNGILKLKWKGDDVV